MDKGRLRPAKGYGGLQEGLHATKAQPDMSDFDKKKADYPDAVVASASSPGQVRDTLDCARILDGALGAPGALYRTG